MKKDRIKNPMILKEIAALGHTEYLCIADCGLPIPSGVTVVDISLTAGIPGFMDVLEAVNTELVTESYILAEEIHCSNQQTESKCSSRRIQTACRKVQMRHSHRRDKPLRKYYLSWRRQLLKSKKASMP